MFRAGRAARQVRAGSWLRPGKLGLALFFWQICRGATRQSSALARRQGLGSGLRADAAIARARARLRHRPCLFFAPCRGRTACRHRRHLRGRARGAGHKGLPGPGCLRPHDGGTGGAAAAAAARTVNVRLQEVLLLVATGLQRGGQGALVCRHTAARAAPLGAARLRAARPCRGARATGRRKSSGEGGANPVAPPGSPSWARAGATNIRATRSTAAPTCEIGGEC